MQVKDLIGKYARLRRELAAVCAGSAGPFSGSAHANRIANDMAGIELLLIRRAGVDPRPRSTQIELKAKAARVLEAAL